MLTKRLKFRELSDEDANALFEIYSDEEAMKFRATPAMKTIADAHQMINRAKITKASNYEIRFAVEELSSQNLIGTCMYQPLENKAIIGYSIGRKFWNNGFGNEIVAFLIELLAQKDYLQIEAWVQKGNTASDKILTKNGFQMVHQTLYPQSNYYILRFKKL